MEIRHIKSNIFYDTHLLRFVWSRDLKFSDWKPQKLYHAESCRKLISQIFHWLSHMLQGTIYVMEYFLYMYMLLLNVLLRIFFIEKFLYIQNFYLQFLISINKNRVHGVNINMKHWLPWERTELMILICNQARPVSAALFLVNM